MLRKEGIDLSLLRAILTRYAGRGGRSPVSAGDMTAACRRVIELSAAEALRRGEEEIGTEHLLSAILSEGECTGARMIAEAGGSARELKNALFPFLSPVRDAPCAPSRAAGKEPEKKTDSLSLYTRDLTALAAAGRLDPVIGREKETARVIRVLLRRTKNNPCLVGEPGVGKTAVVEGLAERIASGDVPEALRGKTVLSVDLPSMIAGAKYRGEFEDRMKKLLSEAASSPDVILFIDELHTVVGAGAAEGAVDASNILKPGLARGEFRLIGATTDDEFRKRIGKDPAFERRFQTVFVEEPTAEEAEAILRGLREKLEAHHGLTITDGALRAAAELSERYVQGKFLPDKALDLLDECAAGKALERRNGETAAVTEEDIALTLTEETGIAVGLGGAETEESLARRLGERVFGQEDAIRALSRAIVRNRAGLRTDSRPVGSFVFVGPSGVGKTELSLSLAEVLFGTKEALLRFDMSGFSEKASVSRLIGSPPGYVGHEEGGQLTDAVRRRPYAVVLFDEIGKAHPDVAGLLLQILDTGFLTDAMGRRVSFRSAVLIMTCNPPSGAQVGFGGGEKNAPARLLSGIFSPELADRIDEVIPFPPLSRESLKKIADRMTGAVSEAAEKLGYPLTFDPALKDAILDACEKEKAGARTLRRLVRRMAEDPVSGFLAEARPAPGTPITVGLGNGIPTVSAAKQNALFP
ncbi:MAG: ATP-dependent Clp protease ATP-binding subunit [Lachnospiraceae bacterium]|nr:ATP-dependent Clp protease ATP-binding subunit [Lachnospiraceae bacterium]